jgi:hypothetical protein
MHDPRIHCYALNGADYQEIAGVPLATCATLSVPEPNEVLL